MIRIIDKRENKVVQKVTKPDGELVAYQAGIPGDTTTMQRFTTLQAAREFVNFNQAQ